MEIREITQKDDLVVQKLIQESLEKEGLNIPGTAYYQSVKKACYWVVEQDQKIVGCGGYGPVTGEPTTCELQKVYVASEARGRGIAKQLIDVILAQASTEYQQIYLETSDQLVAANKLYQKIGFRELTNPLLISDHSAMNRWYLMKLTKRS